MTKYMVVGPDHNGDMMVIHVQANSPREALQRAGDIDDEIHYLAHDLIVFEGDLSNYWFSGELKEDKP